MALLSLSLRWVFFVFCWAPAVLGPLLAGRSEVVTARLNPSHGTILHGTTILLSGECILLLSVSSQQRFGVTGIKALGVS